MFDICKLCSSTDFCKHSKIKSEDICKYFVSKYNCNACKLQCGDDVLCYRFIPKDTLLESNKNHPVEIVLLDLLSELMQIEKSTNNAIVNFQQRLEANGIRAVFTDKQFRGYINNLLALYTLDKLIQNYGLEEFRAQILSNEIDRLFKINLEPEQSKLIKIERNS